MNCQSFHQTFSDYLDGVLDAADAVRVRRHLDTCEPCRRLEAAYRAGVAALRDAEVLCPARELSVRILHRIRRERRLPALSGAYGVAGALLLATLVAAVAFDLHELGEAAPSVEPRLAQTAPPPPSIAAGRFDHITVRLRDASEMLLGDPYAVISAIDPDPSLHLRMEIPAVWSGR
jgi:anti-sigma factor RsiW